MSLILALVTTIALIDGAAAAPTDNHCDVPDSFITSETDLTNVTNEVKNHQRLDISVIGTGSSALAGPDGARYAYPAQLEKALSEELHGIAVKVNAHITARATNADMVDGLAKILADDKPSLVIWQTGTTDAIKGVSPEDFRASLEDGVGVIENANANVILMNMQYSPRTDSMLDVTVLADVMRIVAQQHNALLFDRLGLMRSWNDSGTFDLYTTTKNYDMARRVHECIGRALASQIIGAAHLDAMRMQTTR
jgi:GDSL-like Lipase/Acylhydrolase family